MRAWVSVQLRKSLAASEEVVQGDVVFGALNQEGHNLILVPLQIPEGLGFGASRILFV